MLGMILYYIVLDPCCNVMEDITYCWILETYNVRDDITYCWILATMSGIILHSAGSLLQFQGWYYIVLDPCYTTLQYNTLLLLLNKYCEINSTTLEDTVIRYMLQFQTRIKYYCIALHFFLRRLCTVWSITMQSPNFGFLCPYTLYSISVKS